MLELLKLPDTGHANQDSQRTHYHHGKFIFTLVLAFNKQFAALFQFIEQPTPN